MAFDNADAADDALLLRGVVNNDQSAVREALARGFRANLRDHRGWTPVHEAAIDDKRIDCLKLLLSHPSSKINSQTFLGQTALYLACQHECIETVKLIVSQPKCDVNLPDKEGESPLHVACFKNHFKVIKLLIKCGAKINSQDMWGYTPLNETLLRQFLLSLNRKLTIIMEDEISSIVSYLLSHGSDPDLPDYEGYYPFHFACKAGLLKCVDLLHKASRLHDVINCCSGRESPLKLAVISQNVAVLEYLLYEGANPNFVDDWNLTALHIAARTGNFKIFSMVHQATSNEIITRYCTFDEERDYQQLFKTWGMFSLICIAIDVEDLEFLNNFLNSGIIAAALQCPVIRVVKTGIENYLTLHTPISYLLESRICDLGERTVDFLSTLIKHGSPLRMTSKNPQISYVDPICASLLNEGHVQVVMKCLKLLLDNGADPDYPYGRMPIAMKQACMRSCKDAVLILLQYSNFLEPEDILKWIEKETSSDQEQIIEALLPLAPYYTPSNMLLSGLVDGPQKTTILAPRVYSLAKLLQECN